MTPEIEGMRRFALAAALILIAYCAAGIELENGAKISLLGIPFVIRRPEYLPLGLVLAALYGFARFSYYGVMLRDTPYRIRKDLMSKLFGRGKGGQYTGSVFFGPTKYSTSASYTDWNLAESQLQLIKETFPKVGSFRVTGTIESYQYADDKGEMRSAFGVDLIIPFACRLAAFFQDLDYMAPIWLNCIAFVFAGVTLRF